MLTSERLRELLHYNPETGVFTRRQTVGPKALSNQKAGCMRPDGYLVFRVDGRLYRAHRLAWLYSRGEWPAIEIDHINRNPSDNRMCNLREATRSQNVANTKKHIGNASGFKGVYSHHSRWRAEIFVTGKKRHLGVFDTPEVAAGAYLAAAQQSFGEFANGGNDVSTFGNAE